MAKSVAAMGGAALAFGDLTLSAFPETFLGDARETHKGQLLFFIILLSLQASYPFVPFPWEAVGGACDAAAVSCPPSCLPGEPSPSSHARTGVRSWVSARLLL